MGDTNERLVRALKQLRDRDPVAFELVAQLAKRLARAGQ